MSVEHGSDPLYDSIGRGYGRVRRPDPRIERQTLRALGPATRVVDVGAGAGSYEPAARAVIAVEPSLAMIRQRAADAAPAVRAVAEHLPFPDHAFDGALAMLTVHHWPDPGAGLAELRRVTRGPIVVLTFDKSVHDVQWLVTEYLPEMRSLDTEHLPSERIADALGGGTVEVVPVPANCTDGFCHAWWRRPEGYLDPRNRAAISGIARLPEATVTAAMERLAADIDSGAWRRNHRALLDLDEIDAGYRLVVADASRNHSVARA